MKFTQPPPASVKRIPDFGGRPKRISLDQIVAVRGLGKLKIRPIRLDDEEEMVRFHASLSENSIYLRFFEYLALDRRTTHERLIRVCTNTPESYAIVAEQSPPSHRAAAILAVGRLSKTSEASTATFDTLLREDIKARPLGKVVINRLIKLARAFGFEILVGEMLVADHETLNLCRTLGFRLETLPEDGLVRVTLDL